MAFWFPAGTQVFNSLVGLSREMGGPRGYTEVKTPQLYDSSLWKTSGHWDKYQEHMFLTESADTPMGLKPMNCPGHCQLYSMQPHSYRDLPIRYSEPGLLHRNELSGALHGLLRTRNFAQDDGHVFCAEEQVQDELEACLDFAFDTYEIFGFDVRLELSTRPDERLGSDEVWDRAEGHLIQVLDRKGLAYDINPGDGSFYGPKIDLHMTDSLGRSWQIGTVQLDYNMPMRFGLTYTGADNAEHQPAMIHRALMGSYERFIAILIEHYGGELPVWLTPVQAIVLPIADRHLDYARTVRDELHSRRRAGRARRAHRVGGTQDSRRRAAQDSVTCWLWGTASRRPSRSRFASTGAATRDRLPVERVHRTGPRAGEKSLEPRRTAAILAVVDPSASLHRARHRLTFPAHRS